MARFTIYRSTDSGAPALTGEVNKLVLLLDACLVNGYTAGVTSITRAGSTATVTVPIPHNLLTGQSVLIAGADQPDYNGTFVVTVTSAVVFTYTVPGTPATPATGTITYKRLAAGWTKPFTGTNKASFRQGTGSNQFYLRVQDDGPGAGAAKEARMRGFESMTDVDTGLGDFPTVAQLAAGIICRKSFTADTVARSWVLVADARTFYFFAFSEGGTAVQLAFGFGEFYSLLAGDNFRCMISGRTIENSGVTTNDRLDIFSLPSAVTAGFYIARGHSGTGASVNAGKHGDRTKGGQLGWLAGTMAYTNPANGAFYVSRVWVHDSTTAPANGLRGRMRGFWHWLHPIAGVTNGESLTGTGELAGKLFLVVKESGNTGLYIIETSDTIETN
jgi:hypothetical protein